MNQADATRLVNDLFETLGPFMMRFALRGTRSVETAEDLVQEVFLALYRDLRDGKRIDDPRAWAVGALRNQIRNFVRSCRIHREDVSSPDTFDSMPGPAWSMEDQTEDADLGPQAFRVLSPREEEVVLLRLQSMKYREIGAQLGISSKSVCTLLARALKKLRAVAQAGPQTSPGGLHRREMPNALQR